MALKHYTSFSLVFLATATALLASNAAAHGAVADLCQHTDYPALCRSSVKGRLTAAGATATAIHATILQTAHAKTLAIKLKASEDKTGKANLDVCLEVYDDAISNLLTSLQNLKTKAKADLNINLSAALTDYGTCNDGFSDTGGSSPLGRVNALLNNLASNCLALASEWHAH